LHEAVIALRVIGFDDERRCLIGRIGRLLRCFVLKCGNSVTAGGFVYLAAADLIPELQHDRSLSALFIQTASCPRVSH
jgi:zinc transporter ZupT